MTKNDRWKLFKYGWRNYIPEAVIATFALVMLIYAIIGAFYGFSKLAIVFASMSAALLVGMMLSLLCSRSIPTKGDFPKIYAKKFLLEKWSTDLDGIKMGSEDGAIYIVVITHDGFVFQVNTYDTRLDNQAEEMRSSLDFFRKFRLAKIHYIKAIDLLKLSIDAEEIRHELE